MFLFVSILLTIGSITEAGGSDTPVSSEITICNFPLGEQLKQANLSFYVAYSFEIGEDGVPVRFHKVHNEHIADDKVLSCLKDWRFRGLRRGRKMVATFRWQHGEGWVQLSILGPGYKQVIKIETQ